MTDFWDLPKSVRQKIYRLALVEKEPIGKTEHDRIVGCTYSYRERCVPPLLRLSKKADAEAAPIYYGENHFEFKPVVQAEHFAMETYPRHLRLVRRVTGHWVGSGSREGFLAIARMKGLQELNVRVDERAMVRNAMGSRHHQPWHMYRIDRDPTPQQQLAILKCHGITGLLSISGVPQVQFIKKLDYKNEEVGGPIPGGILETQVRQKMMSKSSAPTHVGLENDTFAFQKLPPEIRNRIYELLLSIPGELHPSTKKASSDPRKIRNRRNNLQATESALSILAVNKQIYDEAVGIFYDRNSFEFYYPTQFHAFVLSLGQQRMSFLRDITIYYQNNKLGGVDLVDLTFPVLKQLPRLRRLRVILRNEIEKKISGRRFWHQSVSWMEETNPLLIPGLKTLFSLRGLTDIKVRDLALEKEFEKAKSEREFPNFNLASKYHFIVQLVNAVEHLNNALADPQNGKVNKKLLNDPQWHMKDVFPTMD